ncbi:hypothetical protein [Duganella sp. BJB475]|uniref:hypothetical protein n=1 Tax=Duganella sp. BJB475 TaxID=2233914 RepID=UPI0011C184D0|nr:hypothetical protein [Duganella sp. BJB475]
MDIQKITSELLASGLTQQELADQVPCSQGLINAYAQGNRGKRPTMAIGNRLIELHASRCTQSNPNPQRATVTTRKPAKEVA